MRGGQETQAASVCRSVWRPVTKGDRQAAGRGDRCEHITRELRKLGEKNTKQNKKKTKTGMIYLVEKCKLDFRAGNPLRPVA